MRICVQGLWHLGPVIAACMARLGHEVIGLDFDEAVVSQLREGIAPVAEPGLNELLREGLERGGLRFSSDSAQALADIDLLWVAYDTPVGDEDVADTEFVMDRIRHALRSVGEDLNVLISSQLPVGSIRQLEEEAARDGTRQLRFACSPENLRLGQALPSFMHPDRVVVGVRSESERGLFARLFASMTQRIEWMSVESAEMTKHAINAFLATSVTFANEIAVLCEATGADASEVERGLRGESRIGPHAYVSPGAAFAGGTLARDVGLLNRVAGKHGLSTPLLASVLPSNAVHNRWTSRKLSALFADLRGLSVGVWGLTYKAGTDTLRRSAAVELCDWMLDQGACVCVHDPAVRMLPDHWRGRVQRVDHPLAAVRGAQALVVATGWPQYREIDGKELLAGADRLVVLDANRCVPQLAAAGNGLRYFAVGLPETRR